MPGNQPVVPAPQVMRLPLLVKLSTETTLRAACSGSRFAFGHAQSLVGVAKIQVVVAFEGRWSTCIEPE